MLIEASAPYSDRRKQTAGAGTGGLRVQLCFARPPLRLEIQFAVEGTRAVLFGGSGTGKTTVLRLLCGLLQPDSGTISLDGKQLVDTARGIHVPAGRRGIGFLPQSPALFPHLSVAANIGFGLGAMPRAARRERVEELLLEFALQPLGARSPARLSGGERQRVALARALAPAPSLLLLDEPFAALDQARRDATMAALEAYLASHPARVLTVSHDVAEVYASRAEVLLLAEGRIADQGPAAEVLSRERAELLRKLQA